MIRIPQTDCAMRKDIMKWVSLRVDLKKNYSLRIAYNNGEVSDSFELGKNESIARASFNTFLEEYNK